MASTESSTKGMQLKSEIYHDMTVTFSETLDFTSGPGSLQLSNQWTPTHPQLADTFNCSNPPFEPRSFSVTFDANDGAVEVREIRGSRLGYFTSITPANYIVVKASAQDEEGLDTDTFTLILKISHDYTLRVDSDPRNNWCHPGFVNRHEKELYRAGFQSGSWNHSVFGTCKYMWVKVPGYRREDKITTFDVELIDKILQDKAVGGDPKLLAGPFARSQIRALAGEHAAREAACRLMGMKNVPATIGKLAGYAGRFTVRFLPTGTGQAWSLNDQTRIFIIPSRAPTIPGGIDQPGRPNIFKIEPPAIPGGRDTGVWTGEILMQEGNMVAILQNSNNNMVERIFMDMMQYHTQVEVDIKVDAADPLGDRSLKAIQTLKAILAHESGEATTSSAETKVHYKIPLTPLFLQGKPFQKNVPHVKLLPNSHPFAPNLLPVYQLEAMMHQTVVKETFTSKFGCTLMQGPPATGKTTIVAKILNIAAKHVDLNVRNTSGKVVCAAQTNEAVRVACDCTYILAKTMFKQDPKDFMCLYLTPHKENYLKLSGRDLGAIKDITLDAHIGRLVASQLAGYESYNKGRNELAKFGRIEDSGLRKRYNKDRNALISKVRTRCTVFFSTLAAVHDQDAMFGEHKLDCRLLVVDEASQATDMSVAQAIIALDPDRILLAGDQNQLSPFLLSPEGRSAWHESLFEKLYRKLDKISTYMLNVQYRTVSRIYAGTQVHYTGRIESHVSTQNRPSFQQLAKNIERVQFREDSTKVTCLSQPVHYFHMPNTKISKFGGSQTCVNVDERVFIEGLVAALASIISPRRIMVLTGYNGQHDALKHLEIKYQGIRVRKIDSSQGDEADVVIFSMVRTAKDHLGFLDRKQRQNVGTSRAREAFFFVGDINVFGTSVWQKHYIEMKKYNQNLVLSVGSPVEWTVRESSSGLQALPPPAPAEPFQERECSSGIISQIANMSVCEKSEPGEPSIAQSVVVMGEAQDGQASTNSGSAGCSSCDAAL